MMFVPVCVWSVLVDGGVFVCTGVMQLLCGQGTVQQIANGDLMRPLLIECWDYDRAGGHDYIGGCSASIADMQVLL